MKVLISGATGLLGSRLSQHFQSLGDTVLPIVRVSDSQTRKEAVAWNPNNGWFDTHSMESADLVIHLAGENVASGRWSRARKKRILESRTRGTRQLVDALEKLPHPPSAFFCASGTGYYGFKGNDVRRESDSLGEGFLAEVCQAWEREANRAQSIGIRTISLRFGVILDPSGGALKKMLTPFRLGLGGRIGSGEQFFPWIAAPEVPKIMDFLFNNTKARGPINVVAPGAITNSEFTHQLSRHLGRPAVIPLPSPVVRLVFGEMGTEMLLGSCQAIPAALDHLGYRFHYPTLEQALNAVISK